MSILQGGPAFPVLSLPLYEYLCIREFHKGLTTLNEDVPNGEVYRLLKQVLIVFVYAYTLCTVQLTTKFTIALDMFLHRTQTKVTIFARVHTCGIMHIKIFTTHQEYSNIEAHTKAVHARK